MRGVQITRRGVKNALPHCHITHRVVLKADLETATRQKIVGAKASGDMHPTKGCLKLRVQPDSIRGLLQVVLGDEPVGVSPLKGSGSRHVELRPKAAAVLDVVDLATIIRPNEERGVHGAWHVLPGGEDASTTAHFAAQLIYVP